MASSTGKSWLAAAAAPVRATAKKGHVLHTSFEFSYMMRGGSARGESYGSSIRGLAEVGTVEEFWAVYNHLVRPHKLGAQTDYFLFRSGVRPMWEDEANKKGGRWTVRIQKSVTSRAFEDLALALVGEQFDSDDVLGIACSVRFQDDVLAIWMRDASDGDGLNAVVGVARRVLQLGSGRLARQWEFKAHYAHI